MEYGEEESELIGTVYGKRVYVRKQVMKELKKV